MGKEHQILAKKKLGPGVYIGSRTIYNPKSKIVSPIGRHQFFFLVPNDPSKFPGMVKDFGDGNYGIVVGSYNVRGRGLFKPRRLAYHRNRGSDVSATKEYFRTLREEGYSGPWKTHLSRSLNPGRETDKLISRIIDVAENFRENTQDDPVAYPGLGATIAGTGLNSNTWVQSIADHVKMKRRLKDFPGYDSGSDLRFPKRLFQEDPPSEEKEEPSGIGKYFKWASCEAFLDGYTS